VFSFDNVDKFELIFEIVQETKPQNSARRLTHHIAINLDGIHLEPVKNVVVVMMLSVHDAMCACVCVCEREKLVTLQPLRTSFTFLPIPPRHI
jgi:hypothetical protein